MKSLEDYYNLYRSAEHFSMTMEDFNTLISHINKAKPADFEYLRAIARRSTMWMREELEKRATAIPKEP
jgi:hypothetical protein